jgi:hypothetical protein
MERLEQTGKEYKINDETIKARKKTTINGLKLKTA